MSQETRQPQRIAEHRTGPAFFRVARAYAETELPVKTLYDLIARGVIRAVKLTPQGPVACSQARGLRGPILIPREEIDRLRDIALSGAPTSGRPGVARGSTLPSGRRDRDA